jgi:hypothetical protein
MPSETLPTLVGMMSERRAQPVDKAAIRAVLQRSPRRVLADPLTFAVEGDR